MKKGEMNMVLVIGILSIAFLAVMSIIFSNFSEVVVFDDVSDSYCKNKLASISSKASGDKINVLTDFFSLNLFEFQRKCQTEEVIIEPNKALSGCPVEVRGMTINPVQTTENCIIHKILTLSERCWDMNGVGTLDGYNWACFDTTIGKTKKEDTKRKIIQRVDAIFQCSNENANENCQTIKNSAIDDATVITIYNSYLEHIKETTKSSLFVCLNEDAKYDDTNLSITLPSGGKLINEPMFNKWYNDLLEDFDGNVNVNLVDPYINYSKELSDDVLNESEKTTIGTMSCLRNDMTSKLSALFTNTTSAMSEQNKLIEDVTAKFCNSRIDKTNCLSQDTTFKLSSELGNSLASHITWSEIENVMAVAKLAGSEVTYEDYFDGKLRIDESIRESSLFQVTYCDGVLPVTSGIVASYKCGSEKGILLSNEASAGGARLAAENIDSTCLISSGIVSIYDSPVTRTMKSICEDFSLTNPAG